MPNENGMEASREDALHAYESFFGDTDTEAVAVPAEEQDTKAETDQKQEASDVAEDEASAHETDPADDLKAVLSIREGRATIGVQRPSSDPHIELFDDPDLSGLTQEVSAVIERARTKWEEAPQYPAYARPASSTGRRSRRDRGSAQDSTAEGGAAEEQRESPRLF